MDRLVGECKNGDEGYSYIATSKIIQKPNLFGTHNRDDNMIILVAYRITISTLPR
jgi:hypothetical protein